MDDILIPEQQRVSARTGAQTAPDSPAPAAVGGPGEMVKVKFAKFVQLVATHDFEDVMQQYGDHDIVVSGNLLTDLASAHEDIEQRDGKKMPIMLLAGIVIGIVLTYFLIRY